MLHLLQQIVHVGVIIGMNAYVIKHSKGLNFRFYKCPIQALVPAVLRWDFFLYRLLVEVGDSGSGSTSNSDVT